MISSWFSPLPQMWFAHKGFFIILRSLNVKGKTIATQVSTMNILLLHFLLLPSLIICLAATADDRWIGSMNMLSVSVSDIIEYLPTTTLPIRQMLSAGIPSP